VGRTRDDDVVRALPPKAADDPHSGFRVGGALPLGANAVA
jgi:hypothetical protein